MARSEKERFTSGMYIWAGISSIRQLFIDVYPWSQSDASLQKLTSDNAACIPSNICCKSLEKR